MKKSLWLLLVVAALIAVFAVAGCMQGTTPEEPAEEPAEEPTPTDYCPTSTTTTLQKIYSDGSYTFKLYIKLDQPVFIQDLSCYENTNYWTVSVSRYAPFKYYYDGAWKSAVYKTTLSSYSPSDTSGSARVTIENVDFNETDSKTFVVTFTIADAGDAAATGYKSIATYGDLDGTYDGLICSEVDYSNFIATFNDPDGYDIAATDGTKYADVISWSFNGTNYCGVVQDAQGNDCTTFCEFEGSLCCEVTYCEECVETPNCPIGGGICQ